MLEYTEYTINSLKRHTLEILIPTYKRPEFAARAINSCIEANDDRIFVSCNSNCKSDIACHLKRDFHKNVRLTSFEYNKGPQENFRYLLHNGTGEYLMLLSDEDKIDPLHLSSFVDFLETLPSDIAIVSNSIWDEEGDDFYFFPNKLEMMGEFSFNAYALLGEPIPTYMSGLTFRNSSIRNHLDSGLFDPWTGNRYQHMDLSATTLSAQHKVIFRSKRLVIKGAEAGIGGDSHGHISKTVSEIPTDLNPEVYSVNARSLQLKHRLSVLSKIQGATSPARIYAKIIFGLRLVISFTQMTSRLTLSSTNRDFDNIAENDFYLLSPEYIYYSTYLFLIGSSATARGMISALKLFLNLNQKITAFLWLLASRFKRTLTKRCRM